MILSSEIPQPKPYKVESLSQGKHFYTEEYPETCPSLTDEINFHGLITPMGQTTLEASGIDPLSFLLETDRLARNMVCEPKSLHPLRGAEGVIDKLNLKQFTSQNITQDMEIALKALNSWSLNGFKNSIIFPSLIEQIFAKSDLKIIRYFAATPHALIRPWIEGTTLDVVFDQLGKINQEFADLVYDQLAKNERIISAHKKIYTALTEYLKTFGFIPMINNRLGHQTMAKDQLNDNFAAKFTKLGEEKVSDLESQKINMIVDFALPNPDPDKKTRNIPFEWLKEHRLGNWILPAELVKKLLTINDLNLTINFLIQNMVCLDPFNIRNPHSSSEGQ